jgi:hypothetical protein
VLVLQVFVIRNGAFEGTEMVQGDRVELGRDPSCALVLDDESCSRKHAMLFEHDGKIAIQDLGSANGTRVNGEPVTSARYVGPRDDVAIGVFTLKVKAMTGQAKANVPQPVVASDPTRVVQAPVLSPSGREASTSAPRPVLAPNPQAIVVGSADDERTLAVAPVPQQMRPQAAPHAAPHAAPQAAPQAPWAPVAQHAQPSSLQAKETIVGRAPTRGEMMDVAPTEALRPSSMSSQEREATLTSTAPQGVPFSPMTSPNPPPMPSNSDERPYGGNPEVTSPDGSLPSSRQPMAAQARATQQGLANADTRKQQRAAAPQPHEDFPVPDAVADDVPGNMVFQPAFLAEELHDDEEDDIPWSLVQRLVKPGGAVAKKVGKKSQGLVEVIHYRGERVVDHQVLNEGDTFKLGARMSAAERRERGIPKVIPLVRLKQGGVAEVFAREDIQGKLLRAGQQVDLAPPGGGKGKSSAVPITDGELASLRVGEERIFIKFAGPPQLIWTKDDAAEDRFARRLNGIALGSSVGLFSLFAVVSWIYQYRNADEEIIAIDDVGFAEVEIKELKMEEPPPEPEKPPEPVPTNEPVPQEKVPDKAVAAPKTEAVPETAPKKPGVLDILQNIPQVNDTASSQNLNAALSNIKGVRVPGGAAGVKVSALIGKGPSSGVQIGGAAGGLSTSGINSLIRKDGQAGALGGKGDRAIAGKATAQPRLLKQTGGELSKEEIQKVINQHIGEIQYCYEKQLRTQPGLSGRVVLDWTVNLQGKVTVVKVSQSTLASSEATNCMMQKLKTWKFPSPRGGAVSIVFPFVFNTV